MLRSSWLPHPPARPAVLRRAAAETGWGLRAGASLGANCVHGQKQWANGSAGFALGCVRGAAGCTWVPGHNYASQVSTKQTLLLTSRLSERGTDSSLTRHIATGTRCSSAQRARHAAPPQRPSRRPGSAGARTAGCRCSGRATAGCRPRRRLHNRHTLGAMRRSPAFECNCGWAEGSRAAVHRNRTATRSCQAAAAGSLHVPASVQQMRQVTTAALSRAAVPPPPLALLAAGGCLARRLPRRRCCVCMMIHLPLLQ